MAMKCYVLFILGSAKPYSGITHLACLVTRPLGETIFRSGGLCERGLEHYA
jgi:hypothetical protein